METQAQVVQTITFLDICRIGGPITAILSGIAILAIIVVTVLGIRAKLKHADSSKHSWWLGMIAMWIFLFGILGFVSDVLESYFKISDLRMQGAMECLTMDACEGLIKIALTGFAALLGLTGAIITKQFSNKESR